MFFLITFSVTAFLLFALSVIERIKNPKKFREIAPGPRPWPLIGSLHLMGGSSNPFEVFTKLSKTYGSIYSITLGSSSCVVVNSFNLIKKVLISKGGHFGGRPDFIRFHKLFGGDRNNCKYNLEIFRPRVSLFIPLCRTHVSYFSLMKTFIKNHKIALFLKIG
ncbi:hypothetical protein RUM44_001434 [Polyplax serrata]|uniref:Cytochrome P450 n=1 Tax=Polyplax serrata TaxID=468196 RepID=A0ABR1AK04_POLSC